MFVHVVVSVTESRLGGDDIIVSQNIWIGCAQENARVLFSDLSTLGPGFKKSPKMPAPSGRNGATIQHLYVYS